MGRASRGDGAGDEASAVGSSKGSINHRFARRMIVRMSTIAATTSTATMAPAQYGCVVASQVRPPASRSSPIDRSQLENGSGLTFAAARALALAL